MEMGLRAWATTQIIVALIATVKVDWAYHAAHHSVFHHCHITSQIFKIPVQWLAVQQLVSDTQIIACIICYLGPSSEEREEIETQTF